jgi:hypothetical protein
MVRRAVCPACGSPRDKTTGHTRPGTQPQPCQACACQGGATAADPLLVAAPRPRMAPLWRARLARRGLGRAVGVPLPWRWPCRGACGAAGPADRQGPGPPRPPAVGRRRLEAAAEARWRGVPPQAQPPGAGWPWRPRHASASRCRGGSTGVPGPKSGGPGAPEAPVRRPRGRRIKPPPLQGGAWRSARKRARSKPGKPRTARAAITRCGSAWPVWGVRRARAPKSGPITSAPSYSSCAPTISRRPQR